MARLQEHRRFLSALVRRPARTGALVPSSRWLAEQIVEGMGLEQARTIVELGPGTGAFTGAIERRAGPGSLVLAIELDPGMAALLAQRFPRVHVVNGSAQHAARHLADQGRREADAVISGLPWILFPRAEQEGLLAAVAGVVRPGGRFATFTYVTSAWLPQGRRFRALLGAAFARVEATPVVWRNLPPAFVYRCSR